MIETYILNDKKKLVKFKLLIILVSKGRDKLIKLAFRCNLKFENEIVCPLDFKTFSLYH